MLVVLDANGQTHKHGLFGGGKAPN